MYGRILLIHMKKTLDNNSEFNQKDNKFTDLEGHI